MSALKIGNAQAFWGDSPDAARLLLEQMPDLDFLTLDYLAELSLSIMAIQMERSPDLGYAHDFLQVLKDLLPLINGGMKTKIVTNAGGLNPAGLAHSALELLKNELKRPLKIGIVGGDSVLDEFKQVDLVTANAYLGAAEIADLLNQGADIVITGRVTDPSLTLGCALHRFGWELNDYDKLAQATLAGHIIECGRQVTGGIATDWLELSDKVNIPFPIVEIAEDASFVVTKPPKTGGGVTRRTVTEQILYEIGDPKRYLSPDVTCDFSSVHLEEEGKNRIAVMGAKGSPPPNQLKVSATYRDGYRAEGALVVYGVHAAAKAAAAGEALLKRLHALGCTYDKTRIERLGMGDSVPHEAEEECDGIECVLRVAVKSSDRISVERFCKEIASLVTSGPQGICGYTSGRPKVRPVFGFRPLEIEREKVHVTAEMLEIQP